MPGVRTISTLPESALSDRALGSNDPYACIASWDKCPQTRDKELGKVSTPQEIARMMARWVTLDSPKTILDPAAGLGNLLLECRRLSPRAKLAGVEKDRKTLKEALTTAPSGTKLIAGDYLTLALPPQDAIIANPPYVKAHFLSYTKKHWHAFERTFGTKLDGLTNLYALFLLKIYEDLAVEGRASIIIPAEFLNANFGTAIKERLLTRIKPRGIGIFDPEVPVFDSALTTSCVLFLKKSDDNPRIWIKRLKSISELASFMNDLEGNTVSSAMDASHLCAQEKWLNILFSPPVRKSNRMLTRRVGDYFKCKRGIATGANAYFCLSPSEIKQFSLNQSDFDPCVTKATHVGGLIFSEKNFGDLLLQDRKCFLLHPRAKNASIESYLKTGQTKGVPQKHLPSHRPVWYLPENREPAAIWVSVFFRQRPKFILNNANIKNLTCFHGLYSLNHCWKESILMVLFLNSSLANLSFSANHRFYGGGLKKVEPKDVEAMACPQLPKLSDRQAHQLLKFLSNSKISGQDALAALDKTARDFFG